MKVVREGKCPSCHQSRTTVFGHPEGSDGDFAFTACAVWEEYARMRKTHGFLVNVASPVAAEDPYCGAAVRAKVVVKSYSSVVGGKAVHDYWVPNWVVDFQRWLEHGSPDHMETVLVLARDNAGWREEMLGASRLGTPLNELWQMCGDKIKEELATRLDEQRLALVRPYIEGLAKNSMGEDAT